MNFFDLILITVLAFHCLKGLVKGFIITAASLAGVVISLIAAKHYYPQVSEVLRSNLNITSFINNLAEKTVSTSGNMEGIPQSIPLPPYLQDKLLQSGENYGNLPSEAIAKIQVELMENLAGLIFNVISFFIILFIVSLAIRIIAILLQGMLVNDTLKGVNRWMGLLIGAIEGGIIGLLIVIAASFILTLGDFQTLSELFQSSKIIPYFYQYDFITPWLSQIIF